MPGVEVPGVEVPGVEVPGVEVPVVEVPVAEVPVAEVPVVEVPVAAPISSTRSLEVINSFRPSPPKPFLLPNTKMPPPAMPSHYGSKLFPRLDPFVSCPSACLTEISMVYRNREKEAYNASRSAVKFSQHYGSRRHNKPFCRPCSETIADPTPIWHRHYSTKAVRLEAMVDHLGRYLCSQCENSPHYFLTGGRSSVLLTSSTLSDFWGMSVGVPYIGDTLHCDSVSVPGGKIADLTRAFKAEFSGHPLPIDAICVLGFNDILDPPCLRELLAGEVEEMLDYIRVDMEGASQQLKNDAAALMQAVVNSSPPNQVNSCAFATLPVPPCLAWRDRSNTTSARAGNIIRGLKIEMLNNFNRDVRDINQEVFETTNIETTRAPSFKSWGMKRRSGPAANSLSQRPDLELLEAAMGPFSNRMGQFREKDRQQKLHFSPYQKLKMGRACLRYFKVIYQLEESHGDNKEEGVARLSALNSLPQHRVTSSNRGIFSDPTFDRCAAKDLPLATTRN